MAAKMITLEFEGGMKVEFEDRKGTEDVPKAEPFYKMPTIAYDVAMDLKEDKVVALIGHAGVGKSMLPEQIFARINQPCIRAAMGEGMSYSDFIGKDGAGGGRTFFQDGMLVKAMREGYGLIVDEVDFCDSAIKSALNGVLEPLAPGARRKLTLKENNGEIVTAHPNFRVILTANTLGAMAAFRHMYQGAFMSNAAQNDRFVRMHKMTWLSPEDEVDALVKRFGLKDPSVARKIVRLAGDVRAAMDKEEVRLIFSMRRVVAFCDMIIRHRGNTRFTKPIDRILYCAESTIFNLCEDPADAIAIKGMIERIFAS